MFKKCYVRYLPIIYSRVMHSYIHGELSQDKANKKKT